MTYFRIPARNHLGSFWSALRLETDVANRYICDVLGEMRTCNETRNFGPLLGLIEECQTMANRMEAGLSDKRDVLSFEARRPILKNEIKELEWRHADLEAKISQLEFRIKELQREQKEAKHAGKVCSEQE